MLIFLVSLLLLGLYLLWRSHESRMQKFRECADKIPGPKGLPLIGNALEFGFTNKSFFEYIKRATKEHGPVARFLVGSKLSFLLAEPVSIESVLGSSKNLCKSSFYVAAEPMLGQGLITNTGEMWKRHRKIVAPTFKGQILVQFMDVFNANSDILTNLLLQHQDGPDFDIFPLFNLFALDVICESAMGVKVNALLQSDSDYVRAINCLENIIYTRSVRPYLHPDIIFNVTPLGHQMAKYVPIVQGMTKRVIEERKKTRSAESDGIADDQNQDQHTSYTKTAFLDYLLNCEEKGAQLNDQEVQDEVNTIMAAGHDTTAASLSFTCWLLAKHQNIQDKAVAELRTIFGESMRSSTVQDVNEMKYIEQILKESLRLFPPGSLFGRRLSEDVDTGEYVLPAGSEIGINVYMLHRHPDYFPDPERFDPDRFLPENCVGRHPYCYIPFSAGPRMCLGYKFAMNEMKITMGKLLRQFKFLPASNPFEDLDLTMQIVLKSINGVRVRIVPRDFASDH